MNDNVPNEFEVDAEIFMGHEISERNNFTPFNFWMGGFDVVGQVIRSFPDDLQLPLNGKSKHGTIVNVAFYLSRDERVYVLYCFENM